VSVSQMHNLTFSEATRKSGKKPSPWPESSIRT
jgi:hypothetical protein